MRTRSEVVAERAAKLAAEKGVAVADTAKSLADELVRGQQDAQDELADAAKKIGPPHVATDVRQIIESVFQIDYQGQWKRLQEELKIGDKRTDRGSVAKSLDDAEDNARVAHQLLVNLKAEFTRYEIDNEVAWAALREEASAQLEAEKEAGDRKKAITDADVRARMALNHPTEFRAVELEARKFKLSVDQAERLADVWMQRCRSLNTLLAAVRG